MKESNNVEPFEVDNPEELYSNKIQEYHFLAKIIIAQAIVIVLLLITLLITNSNVKEYNSDI